MNTAEKKAFNQANIAEFRATGGRLSMFGAAPVLLLTTTGARSGERRTSPMMYLRDEQRSDRVYVFASAAGADNNPAWYHNLLANPEAAVVEIADDKLTASAEVLVGADRDAKFAIQASRFPGFAGYQAQTDRVIPVVALTLQHSA